MRDLNVNAISAEAVRYVAWEERVRLVCMALNAFKGGTIPDERHASSRRTKNNGIETTIDQ